MGSEKPKLDPLGDAVELERGGVPRDRYGRALLYRKGSLEVEPYTSASTLSDALFDDYGLARWDRRMIAKGIGMSRELAALAGSSTYSTNLGEEDEGCNREEGRKLDELVERGREMAKAHQRRDWGSAFHQYTEDRDPLGEPPEEMEADIQSFWDELDRFGIKIVATEIFVANDELTAAGTGDHLVTVPWMPGKLVWLDKKTGRDFHPEKDMVQLTVYDGGDPYEVDDDGVHTRTSYTEQFGMETSHELGITAHTPAGSGKTTLYPLDLVAGLRAAHLAIAVRDHRKQFRKTKKTPVLDFDDLIVPIIQQRMDLAAETAGTPEVLRKALKEIHAEYKHCWTNELSSYGGRILRLKKEGAAA